MYRIHPLQAGRDVPGYLEDPERVGVEVGVSEEMDVPGAPVGGGGDIQQLDPRVHGHVALSALQHVGIGGFVQKSRNPELQVQTGGYEKLGLPEVPGEAGFGPHEVSVLPGIRDGGHLHEVTPDLTDDGPVHGQGGHHPDGAGRCLLTAE